MIFAACLFIASIFTAASSSASTASLKIKVLSTSTIRIGAQITLVCEITPLVDVKSYVLFKDGEIIPANLIVERNAVAQWITISYSFTLTTSSRGEYEFVITFMDDSNLRAKRQIDENTQADSTDESKESFEESLLIGGRIGGLDAKGMCRRCPGNMCTVRDGENCVRDYLDCHYKERPRGLTQCPEGRLFLVDHMANKRTGTCVSAQQCKRERLLPWQKKLGF